jgi:predicted MFS family arabinose efflux permease
MTAKGFNQTAIMLALGAGQMLAFASSFYLLGVMGDTIARDLALRPSLVVSLMSLALLASAVVGPAAGRWTDAHGGKRVLIASNLIFALGLYGTPFAILVELHGDGARRSITGVALIGGLGSSLGWPLTWWLEERLGWRGACFAWAGVHLLVCLPLAAVAIPTGRPGDRATAQIDTPGEPVVWDRTMVQLAVLFACAWFISTCMSTHLPRVLAAVGLTPARAAGVAALVGFAAVSVRLAEFTVLRRLPPLVSTRIATLGHLTGAACLVVLGAAAAPALALGQGAGNGMLTVAKGVLPLSLYGSRNYAYRSALLTRPAQIAQIGGPALYGLALERSPQFALTLSSGLCLLMFAMTFGLGRHPKPAPEEIPA